MAEIVQTHFAESRQNDEPSKTLGDAFGMQWVPVLLSEHETVIYVGAAPLGPGPVLGQPMVQQVPHCSRAEVHPPRLPAACLRGPEQQSTTLATARWALELFPVQLHHLLVDDEVGTSQVHI